MLKRLAVLLALLSLAAGADPIRYALVLHGGAGADPKLMSPEEKRATEKGLETALRLGLNMLKEGKPSLDVVEQVVRSLENDPNFNAGRGAALNEDGKAELDAAIMNGKTMAGGAVASLRTVKNPVSLARLVMEKTVHVLLMGDGAERFADEQKVERVENRYFWTERAQEALDKKKRIDHGTVGCVALDRDGNLAAATSTGGLTGKRFGRVGDSPILGAGTFADNRTCGVSCTGTGEEFIRNSIAHDVSSRLLYGGQTLQEAVNTEIWEVLKPDVGGLIAIDHDGNIVMDFNTPGMSRGAADSTGRFETAIGK